MLQQVQQQVQQVQQQVQQAQQQVQQIIEPLFQPAVPQMNIDTMAPASAMGLFMHTCDEVGLGTDNIGNHMIIRCMKGLARFILMAIALPFFAVVGLAYNCIGVSHKLVQAIKEGARVRVFNDVVKANLKNAGKHIVFGGLDLASHFIAPIYAVGYAVIPQKTMSAYRSIAVGISNF